MGVLVPCFFVGKEEASLDLRGLICFGYVLLLGVPSLILYDKYFVDERMIVNVIPNSNVSLNLTFSPNLKTKTQMVDVFSKT